MESEKAIDLLFELMESSIAATNESNSRTGMKKQTVRKIRKYATLIFVALIGRKPTRAELHRIVD